jgi:hypothetical protein
VRARYSGQAESWNKGGHKEDTFFFFSQNKLSLPLASWELVKPRPNYFCHLLAKADGTAIYNFKDGLSLALCVTCQLAQRAFLASVHSWRTKESKAESNFF